MADPPSPAETVRLLVRAARSEGLGFLGAAIAYYAFVSIVPLTLLALAVASVVGGDVLAAGVREAVSGVLTPEAAALIEDSVASETGRGSATIIGLLVLTWSGLRLFRGLHAAFGRIYGRAGTTSLGKQLRDAAVTLIGIAVALGVLAVVLVLLARPSVPSGTVFAPVAIAVVLPVAFFPIYYVLPDVPMAPRAAIPGAVLAGVGWTLLGWGFALYATYAATASVYGAIGTVLLVLTWFYAGAVVVLLGAVLNAVRSGRVEDRQVQQVAGRDPPHE